MKLVNLVCDDRQTAADLILRISAKDLAMQLGNAEDPSLQNIERLVEAVGREFAVHGIARLAVIDDVDWAGAQKEVAFAFSSIKRLELLPEAPHA